MSAISDLFAAGSIPSSCQFLPLVDASAHEGFFGPYLKLYCQDDGDLPIEIVVDARYFPYLEPYIDILRSHREEPETTAPPEVPLYRNTENQWRFSWKAAHRDYPTLTPASPESDTPTSLPEPAAIPADRAYRMQVSVPGELANRFRRRAAAQGLRHTDLLLTLIRDAVS